MRYGLRNEYGERTSMRPSRSATRTPKKTWNDSSGKRLSATPPVSVEPNICRGATPKTRSAASETSFVSSAPLETTSTTLPGISYCPAYSAKRPRNAGVVTSTTFSAPFIFAISSSGVRMTSGSAFAQSAFGSISIQSFPYMWSHWTVPRNVSLDVLRTLAPKRCMNHARCTTTSFASDSNVFTTVLESPVEPEVWNTTRKRLLRTYFSTANVSAMTTAETAPLTQNERTVWCVGSTSPGESAKMSAKFRTVRAVRIANQTHVRRRQ